MARMPRGLFIIAMLLCCSALADLRVFSSRFYQVHTDLEPGVAQDLAKRLDVMHEEYARRLIRFGSESASTRVDAYLFARQSDYLQFAGEGMGSTGGVYMPGRNALAAFHDGQGRDSLRRTLQHEAFHQFAAKTISNPPADVAERGDGAVFRGRAVDGRRFFDRAGPAAAGAAAAGRTSAPGD